MKLSEILLEMFNAEHLVDILSDRYYLTCLTLNILLILSEDITVDMFNAEHLVDILSEDITVDMFNAEHLVAYIK